MAEKSIGTLKGRISMEVEEMKSKMQEARDELGKMSGSGQRLNKDLGRIQTAGATVFAVVSGAIAASVKTAGDFEQSMARVKAISGATDEEFSRLERTARELGASTQFSASEAAEGMSYLAMAGFEVNETIAAMPGVLNLAAASQQTLATSADIVSNILSGFGLSAEESGNAVDILVKTMSTANTDLPMLGDAMKYVAPVASSLGLSMEETAAAVGKMSDAGIQGSQAGTALRAMLLSLANPTGLTVKAMEDLGIKVTDANGAMKPIPELIGHIGDKLSGMEDAQKTATAAQLVGTEAASGFLALLEVGEDGLADYTAELENAGGTAERVAETQMDTLNGSFKEFQSALEEIGIKVGNEFLPAFRDIVDQGANVVRFLTEVDGETFKVGLTFLGTTAAVATTLATLGKLSIALSAFAMTPVGAAIIGVSLLAGAIGAVAVAQSDAKEVNLDHANALIEEQSVLDDSITRYDSLREKTSLSNDQILRYLDLNKKIAQEIDPSKIEAMKDEQAKLQEKSGLTNQEFSEMLEHNQRLIDLVPESTSVISDQGSVLIENTDAAKGLNDELREKLRLELESQLAKANENEVENLKKQAELVEQLKEGYATTEALKKTIFDDTVRLSEVERELADAQKNNDYERADRLADERLALLQNLDVNKQELTTQAETNVEKQEELDKINEQIRLGKEAKQGLVDLVMSQTDLNAEKGKEIQAIDTAISKLETEKKKLQSITPEAEKNTDEYRKSIGAIDSQITGLENTRRKVIEITGQVDLLNRKLGQSVTKTVYVKNGGSSLNGPTLQRHSGGIIQEPIGKLHSGGFPSNLISDLQRMPQHNEIDVRLLKNEMVLTESQQANLMRMIDAGVAGPTQDNSVNAELLGILRELRIYGIDARADVFIDKRSLAQGMYKEIREFQKRDESQQKMRKT
ncbi:phage tail tape measure protein [Chryseomicrobium palamuruense]